MLAAPSHTADGEGSGAATASTSTRAVPTGQLLILNEGVSLDLGKFVLTANPSQDEETGHGPRRPSRPVPSSQCLMSCSDEYRTPAKRRQANRKVNIMRKTSLSLLSAAAGAALTLITTQPRIVFDGVSTKAAAADAYRQLSLFGDVFERVRTDYVEKPDDSKLVESAINGMLAGLDPPP